MIFIIEKIFEKTYPERTLRFYYKPNLGYIATNNYYFIFLFKMAQQPPL